MTTVAVQVDIQEQLFQLLPLQSHFP